MIKEKYPDMFHEYCGISIGEGWGDILDALCSRIRSHLENNKWDIEWTKNWNANVLDPNYDWGVTFSPREVRKVPEAIDPVCIHQVKEKFGTLRVYYYGGNEYIRGLVGMAEAMSARTCETCGNPGTLRGGGWITTLCDEHALGREKLILEGVG